MMQANVERDSSVTDFNLGRQGTAATAPRTASATMALLAQTRKSYGMLVRRCAAQFSKMLSFHFRLWQAILPDDTYVGAFIPRQTEHSSEASSALWDRLFSRTPLSDTGHPTPQLRVALPISKEALSGFFDAAIEVNPEEEFDRQAMISLLQLTAPAIQDYPIGIRLMLKRVWS